MQQKLNWVDNLKVFGILAVILGHIASPLGGFIFSWHMPLFFIIAGFFIKFDLAYKEFLLKNFKRLMIPYFIFASMGLILEILKRYALDREELSYFNEFQGIFIWMDMPSLINSYAFALWFLPTLFFAKVMLFFINKNIENLFLQFLIVLIFFSISFFINLPFGFDNAMNSLLFLFIGNIFFRFNQDGVLLYILSFILVGIYLFAGVPSLDLATKSYSNILLNILFSLSIIYVFISIFKKISIDNKLLTLWGGKHNASVYFTSIYK